MRSRKGQRDLMEKAGRALRSLVPAGLPGGPPGWLRERDRDLRALRRAARTAIVMPAMFAIGDKVIGNPAVATFAAFGSFAMLLLVDFTGSTRDRLQAQAALAVVGGVFVCVGTLASRAAWLAATAMFLVGFCVLFAGVVSSVLAGAATSLLLAFILPVSLAGPPSSVPDRLAGWGIASAAAVAAVALLWPAPAQDPLRGPAAAACRALAARLRAQAAHVLGGAGQPSAAEPSAAGSADAAAQASAAVSALHRGFISAPYRPTGLSTDARAVVRLVDELNWLSAILAQAPPPATAAEVRRASAAVKSAAAAVLEAGSDLLDAPGAAPDPLRTAAAGLREALAALERSATANLPVHQRAAGSGPADGGPGDGAEQMTEFLTSLDVSFRTQELGFVVSLIARNIDLAAAAARRSWWERLLGHQPEGLIGPFAAAWQRAAAHLKPHSVWLHNSVRGAAGLGLAVLVASLSGVQHSFWVVLGALSVLRSNALSTGQSVVRAVLGTGAGFVIGAVLLTVVGTNPTVLWLLLPLAILFAGVAPAVISFEAGQAAFTLTLVILFNIIQPAGWRVGLLRVEDIALGCAVSLVVGLLFWPRGAGAALRTALAEAYSGSARYLASAVEFGVGRCDAALPAAAAPTAEEASAAAAARRLDDTFRNYLAERGAKPVPLAEVTSLLTGVAALRLTADAVVDLWERDDGQAAGDRAQARGELLSSSELVRTWYDDLAASIAGPREVPAPLAHDKRADARLVGAVRHDLSGEDGQATGTAVRMIWTGDHLDAARRLQVTIAGPARTAKQQSGRGTQQ